MTKVPDNFDRAALDCTAPMITLTKTCNEFGEIRIVKSRIKGSHSLGCTRGARAAEFSDTRP